MVLLELQLALCGYSSFDSFWISIYIFLDVPILVEISFDFMAVFFFLEKLPQYLILDFFRLTWKLKF